VTTKPPFRIALALGALVLVPTSVAAPGGGGSGGGTQGKTTCTRNAPGVFVDNNWAWGQTGSWGLPGQQLTFGIQIINNDVGCRSSSFVVNMSAPSGFAVSFSTSTLTLKSSSSGYLWGTVTSPSVISDGDYPLTVTAARPEGGGTATSYYKVYSSDTVAPTLYFPNPGDGTTISGNSYNVVVSSRDDHAVKRIDLYIDDAYKSTTSCDNVTYSCSLSYLWSLSGTKGSHTATFRSVDWMGNTGILNVAFTVG
jgi:hypothetical protein